MNRRDRLEKEKNDAKLKLTDISSMPWGKHKGEAMANVPASYLLFLYDNDRCSDNKVRLYIEENEELLRKEAQEEKV